MLNAGLLGWSFICGSQIHIWIFDILCWHRGLWDQRGHADKPRVSTWIGKCNYVEDSDYEHQLWVPTSQELRPCRQYLEGDGNLSLRKDRVFSGVWGQRRESPAEWVSSSKQCPDREVCVHHYMRDCLLWQLRGVRCISLDQNIISRRPRWSVRPLRDGQSVTVSLCTVLTSLQEKVQSVGALSLSDPRLRCPGCCPWYRGPSPPAASWRPPAPPAGDPASPLASSAAFTRSALLVWTK